MSTLRPGLVLFFVALIAVPLCGIAQDAPNYADQPNATYMTRWLLCGPFPCPPLVGTAPGFDTDYLAAAGGERAAQPQSGQAVTCEGTTATWTLHESPSDIVNLAKAVAPKENVAAYAYCTVEAPTDASAVLSVGSNDSVRIWINGEEVWSNLVGRKMRKDEDRIPVRLKTGRNTMLAKIENKGLDWAFSTRFLPFDPGYLNAGTKLFRVEPRGKAAPSLVLAAQPSLVGTALQRVELSVAPAASVGTPVWTAMWNGKSEMPIGVDPSRYAAYLLHARQYFAGGKTVTTEYSFTAGDRIERVLFDGGKSDYSIVLGKDASDSEKWAAQELQARVKDISGLELPVRTYEPVTVGVKVIAEPGPEIVIGFNERVQELMGPSLQAPADTDESFVYRTVGPALVICGGKQRGTMYGVESFLEREFGVRWYTPKVTVAPKKTRYAFTALDHSEKPGVRVRNDFYAEAFDPIWAAHNRVNGAMGYREQIGGVESYWGVHTFYPMMPPEEFFATHPEYYSLIDGKRTADRAQLCLTNPDVLKIMIERISKVIRDNPQNLIYDVSQNDWHGPCQCDKCQAIAKQEESESGVVIWFVNQVAEAIEKEFPDKYIGTLAYQYTRKPPKSIRPRENVVVRFCSIECCFSHPFGKCPQNDSFIADMEGWKALAPHIYIWDYVVNFSHYTMPYPNFHVLQPNIQFFRDHNAIGIMEQAAYQSRGGEFSELRMYVIAKLLWDPNCDVDYWVNDFMYGYYGRAGQYVKAYFDLLHSRITPDTHIHLGLTPGDKLFSDEFVRQSEALFDQAETVADSEEVRQRVEMARMPIMYLKCKRTPSLAKQDGTYDRFLAIMARENITLLAEAGAVHLDAFKQEMEQAK